MGLCCSLNFDFHANRSQIMRKIPTKTTQIVASRESPVLAAALHTQCPLGALTCGICQERRGIWWRHHVQQLEKSGSKSVGCTQGAGRRGVQGGVHDRRGARTTTKPKAPEIIMTPAWQLGQRRNICLVTQHENIFPLSSRPTRGPAGLSRVPCMGFFYLCTLMRPGSARPPRTQGELY